MILIRVFGRNLYFDQLLCPSQHCKSELILELLRDAIAFSIDVEQYFCSQKL